MAATKSSKRSNENQEHFRSLSPKRRIEIAQEILRELMESNASHWAMISAVTTRLESAPPDERDEPSLAICRAFEDLASDVSSYYRLGELLDVIRETEATHGQAA